MNGDAMKYVFVIFAASALACQAAPRYVATNGNDGNGGTSWDDAVKTIAAGITKAVGAGDVVLVSNGEYLLTGQLSLTKNVTVRSWNNGNIDPTNTIVNAGGGAFRCAYLNHVNATLDGFTLTNAAPASNGGGVRLTSGTVRNCIIVNNTPSEQGAGIYMTGGRVEGSVIRANRTDNQYGGGIYMTAGTVSNCSIVSNATYGVGGVYIGATGRVENCWIQGNSGRSAGGIYFGSDGSVANCEIAGNVSTGGYGGGINVDGAGTVSRLIENCVIVSNISAAATGYGGGIRFSAVCRTYGAVARNCLIAYNTATDGGIGGGIVMVGPQNNSRNCRLENCTVVYNKALVGGDGGGVTLYSGGQMINCVIYYNSADTCANMYLDDSSAGTARVDYSCSYPLSDMGTQGQNNMTNAPLLADTNAGKFRLTLSSPCVNKGTNMEWMAGGRDLDNHDRLDQWSRLPDIGAYEVLFSGMMSTFH